MSIGRTSLSWLTAASATPVFATMAVVGGRIATARVWPHRVARRWARLLLTAAGARVSLEGPLPSGADGPIVLMSNHLSSLDIPALLASLDPSLKPGFLAKASLFRIPFLGCAMRALGCVAVERDDLGTAASALARALAELHKGRSMIAFPEGTWGPGGELLPFHRGPFLLALRARVAVVPVGLNGPERVLPPSDWRVTPGTVRVRFGRAIATSGRRLSDLGWLVAEVRDAISALHRGP